MRSIALAASLPGSMIAIYTALHAAVLALRVPYATDKGPMSRTEANRNVWNFSRRLHPKS